MAATAAKTYTLSGFSRRTGGAFPFVFIKFLSSSFTPLVNPYADWAPTTTWTAFTLNWVAPAGTAYVEISVTRASGAGAPSDCVFLDDLCLTESGGGTLPNFIIQGGAQNMATAGTTLNDVTIILSTPASPAFSGAINGHFYLSTDQVFSANDVFLKNLDWASVQPVLQGGSLINTGLPIPAATAAGSYFFIFVLDPANLVAETNENDNTMTFPVTISAAGNSPDILLGTYITPPTLAVGSPATALVFYQNAGNVAAGAHNYTLVLSTDNVLGANDLPLGGFNVASLAAGASGSNSITFTLAATQAAGTYYLIAKGVISSNVSSFGFGSAKPVNSNETAEGKKQNRRVEFILKKR